MGTGRRGGVCMMPGRAGSTPRVMAGGPSMMMLTQRIWIAVNGVGMPNSGAPSTVENCTDVGGKLEAHELDNVVVDGAAFLDRAHDRGEIVVGEHQGGGFLGHLGAGDPHGDADVGGLQRRRVVDAVASHGHDVATRLQCLDDAQLVFGRDTGEHGGFLHQFGQCGRVEAVEHAAFVRLAGQAEFAGDGRRRDGVIAGDHLHRHAGGPAQADGFLRLGRGGSMMPTSAINVSLSVQP